MSKIKRQDKDIEIDFIDVIKTIWDGKWKIIVIIIISTLLCTLYYNLQPPKYNSTTTINAAGNSEFIKYTTLNDILLEKFKREEDLNLDYLVNSSNVFNLLVSEFRDYDEVVEILKNDPNISKSLINIPEANQRHKLIGSAKSFVILDSFVTPKQSDESKIYTLSYTWHNIDEGRKIFQTALDLSLLNVKNKIVKDISQLAESIDKKNIRYANSLSYKLKMVKMNDREKDLMRLRYLTEQSDIAKDLGIKYNQIQGSVTSGSDSYLLKVKSKRIKLQGPSVEVPIEFPYFLIGYEAIDREINSIKDRSDSDILLTSYDYNITKQELIKIESDLSSQELREYIKILEADDINNWINYDFSLGISKSLKNLTLYLMVGIFVGFLIGTIYVLTSNAFTRNKKKALN